MAANRTITFNLDPPFQVDFWPFIEEQRQMVPPDEPLPVHQRAQKVAFMVLKLVSSLFVAMFQSARIVLSTAGTSFKYVVLGYYGSLSNFHPPATIYLAVFKVAFWVLGMAWCFTTTTGRLLYERFHDNASTQALLSQFAGQEIDVEHIQTRELAIDVSDVPEEVTVSSLAALFDEINFDKPNEPGYMAPLSRKEGFSEYTPGELKKSLGVFIDRVNTRAAFLGTPPTTDVPRLMDFYQQIEDAVRFSIHKANRDCEKAAGDFEEFMRGHGVPEEGSVDRVEYEKLLNAVKDSLEARARIGINLAFAGRHCGARFMGEAMELYDSFNQEASFGQGTLRDALIEVLAAKRKEIAREQIQTHVGSDTHHYNNYMSSLGHILAIPGTKNVIEHLSFELARPRHLRLFFKEYTVDCIIATIQGKIKTSQAFREKITDWFRDNCGEWNAEMSEQELRARLEELDPILQQDQIAKNFPIYQNFMQLQELIAHLKAQGVVLPDTTQDLDDFFADLFALLTEQLPKNPIQKAQMKQNIKSLFSDEQLGQALINKFKEGSPLKLSDFHDRFLELQKVKSLSEKMKIEEDVALRIVKREKPLAEAIAEKREQERGPEFLAQLVDPEGMLKNGLSQELIEWVLVSQKVLLPQE